MMEEIKKGLRYYWFYEFMQIVTWVNGFLYGLRKLPFIGKLIPNTVYKTYGLKKALSVLVFIVRLLLGLLAKFIWLGIYYAIASFMTSLLRSVAFSEVFFSFEANTAWKGLLLWFAAVLLVFWLVENLSYTVPIQVLTFIDNFQMSKKTFIRSFSLIGVLRHGLLYMPATWVLVSLTGASVNVLIGVSLWYISLRYLFMYFSRLIFLVLSRKVRIVMSYVSSVPLLGLAVGLAYFGDESWAMVLFTPMALVVAILVLIFSLWKVLTFNKELTYLENVCQDSIAENAWIEKVGANAVFDSTMKQKIILDKTDKFDEMSGNNYLNALLFQRFRSSLFKSLRWRLVVIAAAGIGLIVVAFFTEPRAVTDFYSFIPIMFFYLYMISFGKKIMQMVFANCDAALLHYPFYREKDVIISGFLYRFKKVLLYNGLLAGLSYIFLMVAAFVSSRSFDWMFMGIMAFIFLSLVAIFSFHELFLYYLLQPFTENSQVTNPIYNVANSALWFFAYFNLNLDTTGLLYPVGLAIVSFLYVIIGLLVILKVAPKTFKLR